MTRSQLLQYHGAFVSLFYREDDMQSNFSHLSEADLKQRLSELVECSDDEEEEGEEAENKENDRDRITERSKQ